MTIAYWCVFIFMFFPFVTVIIGKVIAGNILAANHDPRNYIQRQSSDLAKRFYHAHLNAIEMFAPFAAAVIITHLQGSLSQSTIDNLALAFIVSRVIYVVAYVMDWALFRTFVWSVGFILVSCYFILPLFIQ